MLYADTLLENPTLRGGSAMELLGDTNYQAKPEKDSLTIKVSSTCSIGKGTEVSSDEVGYKDCAIESQTARNPDGKNNSKLNVKFGNQ